MLRVHSAVLALVALLAAAVDAGANLRIENEHGACVLDTALLDDGRNAFNTSCPIADVAALQQTVETALQQTVETLQAQLDASNASLSTLQSAHDALQSDHDALQSSFNALQLRVETLENAPAPAAPWYINGGYKPGTRCVGYTFWGSASCASTHLQHCDGNPTYPCNTPQCDVSGSSAVRVTADEWICTK